MLTIEPIKKAFPLSALLLPLIVGCNNPSDTSSADSRNGGVGAHPCFEGMTAGQIESQNTLPPNPSPLAKLVRGNVIEFTARDQTVYQFQVKTMNGYFQMGTEQATIQTAAGKIKTTFPMTYIQGADDRFHQLPRFNIKEMGRCILFEGKETPDTRDVGIQFLRNDGLSESLPLPKYLQYKDYFIFNQLMGYQQQLYFRVSPANSSPKVCKSAGRSIDCLEIVLPEHENDYRISEFTITRSGDLWVTMLEKSFAAKPFLLKVAKKELSDLGTTRVTAHLDRFQVAKNPANTAYLTPIGNSLLYRNSKDGLNLIVDGRSFSLNLMYQDQPFKISDTDQVRYTHCDQDLCIQNLTDAIFKTVILRVSENGQTIFSGLSELTNL